MNKTSLNIEENIEALLSYLLLWVTGLLFLILEKDNKFVKFHAMQSIITFGALTVGLMIFTPIPIIGIIITTILSITIFVLWIFLMLKAYQGEKYKLPIIGDIAENFAK